MYGPDSQTVELEYAKRKGRSSQTILYYRERHTPPNRKLLSRLNLTPWSCHLEKLPTKVSSRPEAFVLRLGFSLEETGVLYEYYYRGIATTERSNCFASPASLFPLDKPHSGLGDFHPPCCFFSFACSSCLQNQFRCGIYTVRVLSPCTLPRFSQRAWGASAGSPSLHSYLER